MFIRKKVSEFKWPVKVKEPTDGGKFQESEFTAIFRRIGRKKFAEMSENDELALLKEILAGWEDIEDAENGKPLAFSAANLAELSDDQYWVRGLLRAYTETFDEARQGN